jgi:hypothetical protein
MLLPRFINQSLHELLTPSTGPLRPRSAERELETDEDSLCLAELYSDNATSVGEWRLETYLRQVEALSVTGVGGLGADQPSF